MFYELEFLKEYVLFLWEEGEFEKVKYLLYYYLEYEFGDVDM